MARLLLIASALVLVLLAVAVVDVSAVPNPPVIQTTAGKVQGYIDNGVAVWRGIPFAAPPTGSRRFKAPEEPEPWSDTKLTFFQTKICPQVHVGPLVLGTEDCLYLDVYAPTHATPDSPLPVMFWIYGGGFVFGDGYEFGFYDGQNLAKTRDVVVVAPNYRLSSFGFMALDALQREDPNGSTGNYGTQDQRAAMKWVQKNIRQFGGDPNRVTIFGESAGAMSVCYHIASPASAGLFHAAIMESGTCSSPEFFVRLDKAKEWSEGFSRRIGCDPKSDHVLDCLRELSTTQVMHGLLANYNATAQHMLMETMLMPEETVNAVLPPLYPVMPWGPAIDGTDVGLPKLPYEMILEGNFNKVPYLGGTNENEGSIFVIAVPIVVPGVWLPLNDERANRALGHLFNTTVVERINQLYPANNYGSQDKRVAAILRDWMFRCSTRRAVRAMTDHGVPAYLYLFYQQLRWVETTFLGDYHSSEIGLVFGNQWPIIVHDFTKDDARTSEYMQQYWINFAKNHDPNGGAPNWPRYDRQSDLNIILNSEPTLQAGLGAGVCDFWDSLVGTDQGERRVFF